jgi:hypothetical protein
MQSDLSFLPGNLSANEDFSRAWDFAVSSVRRHAEKDCNRKSKAYKKQVAEAATSTFSAALLLRDEIDSGVLADVVVIESFANEHGFSSTDIQTVRSFLHFLAQQVLVESRDELDRIPNVHPKSAVSTAAYFVGCICRQFDLGEPKNYVSESRKGKRENVAISLLRCLLIEGKEDHQPSDKKLKGYIKIAKEGYENYRPKM